MSLLIPEHPLQVLPALAARIGLNEAIFLQQLHYWLQKSDTEALGYRWVYNTAEQWQEQFPFWSTRTVERIVSSLRDQGLVITVKLMAYKHDQRNYYRINYESGALHSDNLSESGNRQLGASHPDKLAGSDAATLAGSSYRDYTETTAETTTESRAEARKSSPRQKVTFDADTGRFEGLSDALIDSWSSAYPAIDVRLELRKAAAWLMANPKNRKSDYPRFLNNWLARQQDQAPRSGAHARPARFDAFAAANQRRTGDVIDSHAHHVD